MTARRRVMTVVAIAAAATALLTGCEGRPGTAAIVDGKSISTADVDTVVRELQNLYSGADRPGVLIILTEADALNVIAEDVGAGVSPADVQQALDGAAKKAGITNAHFSQPTRDVIRFSLEWTALQKRDDADDVKARIDKTFAAQHVVVNPRFGAPSKDATLVPTERPWIHVAKS